MQWLPPDGGWDDASNNKFLVSGQGALIMNPPSAWAVAKRDAPQVAEQCWTHGMPAGPKGRFGPFLPFFWCIWNFSKNVPAAKSLLAHLSTAPVVESMVVASGGYDLPSFEKLTKFKVWAEEGPPKGTLLHYPDTYHHQTLSVACARRTRSPSRCTTGHRNPDGGSLLQGRAAGEDPGLGIRRTRRLHAHLGRKRKLGGRRRQAASS
jgi:hypothetical protein